MGAAINSKTPCWTEKLYGMETNECSGIMLKFCYQLCKRQKTNNKTGQFSQSKHGHRLYCLKKYFSLEVNRQHMHMHMHSYMVANEYEVVLVIPRIYKDV